MGTPQRDVIVTKGGDDVVHSGSGKDLVCGGPGEDRLVGGGGRDRLAGGKGDDRIVDGGGGSSDLLLGGPGEDVLVAARSGYSDSKTLVGGPGADQLIDRGSFEVTLAGGAGPDRLTSRGHNGWLDGGPSHDLLTLAGTGDTVVVPTGDGDRIQIRRAGELVLLCQSVPGGVDVDLVAGTVRRLGAASGDVIVNIGEARKRPYSVVYGTHGNDRISGRDDGSDEIYALAGDDVVSGRGGRDILDGGRGDDYLDGGHGRDMVRGGKGDDTCVNAGDVAGCSP